MKKRKLVNKMIYTYLLASLIPTLAVGVIIPQYYRQSMNDQIEVLTETILVQASQNLLAYHDSLEEMLQVPYRNNAIMDALKSIEKNYDNQTSTEYVSAKGILFGQLPYYIHYSNKEVAGSIFVFDENRVMSIYTDGKTIEEGFAFHEEYWYKAAIEASGRNIYVSNSSLNYIETDKDIFSVARTIYDWNTSRRLGVFKIDIYTEHIGEIFSQIEFNVQSNIVLRTGDDVIYSSFNITQDMLEKLLDREQTKVVSEDEVYQVRSLNVEETPWTVDVLISETQYNKQLLEMQIFVLALCGVVIGFATLGYTMLVKRIIQPLSVMCDKMQEVEQGNYNLQLEVEGDDEIATLIYSFNDMLKCLNETIEREYKATIASQQAQYNALQSQIEPHFLYNVLNNIVGINRMGDKQLVEEMVVALAELFRYMTEYQGEITLEKECYIVERFCMLQKCRLGSKLEYQIEISETTYSCVVPKLLLQPLVENSIIYGLKDFETLHVLVKAWCEEGKIHILVKDNGKGFDTTIKKNNNSVGIKNVEDRVKFHRKDATYQVESAIGIGTRVEIIMPILG